MSVVKTRSVSPCTPSHSAFALLSLTGPKPIMLQKSKASICCKPSSLEVLLPHSCLLAPGARSEEHTWHLNGMQERSEVAPGSCEGLSSSPKVFSSAHSLSSLQGRAARVSLSTNVSYLTAGAGKLPLCLDIRGETRTERQKWRDKNLTAVF